MSRHPTPPPQWKPPPQKKLDAGNRSRLTAASYLPTPFRCGEAGSPCLSRCLWATVRQCANSPSAARSAAQRHAQADSACQRQRGSPHRRGISGTAGVDERSDEVSKEHYKPEISCGFCSRSEVTTRSLIRSAVMFYFYSVAADLSGVSPEEGLLIRRVYYLLHFHLSEV